MSSEKKKEKLPTLLVIASTNEENWVNLCSEYSNQFRVIQTTWDKISLSSYSDSKYPIVTIYQSINPLNREEDDIKRDIKPDLVLIRNLARYISGKIETVPDFRNVLYGFYHSNIPMINELSAIIAELEKPIMYGRLRKIRDLYGEKNFPLIQQYYYPNHSEICVTPNAPYVIKVSFPHAGYGKIRVKDYHELDDIRSIIALHKDYIAIEPLIDVDYELRIVFIAPNYYRVHKRSSMNWKVNFGMTNIREDCEMKPEWKKWIDLIYKTYPDMLTFDIDAIVDKKGKEYILEVNGSSQGFAPEHGKQDLEHLRDLVIRKMEIILNKDLLKSDNEAKKLFMEDNKINVKDINYEKDTEIVNLKNTIDDYKCKLNNIQNKYNILEEKYESNGNKGNKIKNLLIYLLNIVIICLGIYIFKNRNIQR